MILTNSELHNPTSHNLNLCLSSIALVAPFTGLRQFLQGRGFKQWTGDDSKTLIKVGPIAD